MPHLNRNALLDWFDDFDASAYSASDLVDAYNALTGDSAVLVCGHCGLECCAGRQDMAWCPWLGINDCKRCGSKERGYCSCEIAANE